MRLFIRILFVALATIFPGIIFAQGSVDMRFSPQKDKILEASPQAAAAIKYVDYPISYALGIADISVPIYDVKSRELSLPISLSYHGSGIKVNDISGTVGLGWTLNAGGVITRTVMGMPDNYNGAGSVPHSVRPPIKDNPTGEDYDYLKRVMTNNVDAQRDKYSFNFCGYTGSFYVLDDGTIQCTMPTELTIDFSYNTITVKDKKGITYYFEQKETTRKSIVPPTNTPQAPPSEYYPANYTAVTSWYLTKIVSMNGTDQINISYTKLPFLKTVSSSQSRTYTFQYRIVGGILTGGPIFTWLNKVNSGIEEAPEISTVDLTTTIYHICEEPYAVDSIKFNNGTVKFTYVASTSPAGDTRRSYTSTLSSIVVKNSSGTTIKTIGLATIFSGDYRNLLSSLTFKGLENKIIDSYSFEYNSPTTAMADVSQDLFGYYNGANNRDKVFLTLFDDAQYAYQRANRNYNFGSAQALSLKSITTGSGAKTEFEYEANQASGSIGPLLSSVGIGVRIKSIKVYDTKTSTTTPVRKRSFAYGTPYSTINFANIVPLRFTEISESHSNEINGEHVSPSYPYYWGWTSPRRIGTVIFTDQSCSPGGPLEGAKIFYNYVTETITGPNSGENVKMEYEYNCFSAVHRTESLYHYSELPDMNSHDDIHNSLSYYSGSHFFARVPYYVPRISGQTPSIGLYRWDSYWVEKAQPEFNNILKKNTYKYANGTYSIAEEVSNAYEYVTSTLQTGLYVKSLLSTNIEEGMNSDHSCLEDFHQFEILVDNVYSRLSSSTTIQHFDVAGQKDKVTTSYIYNKGSRNLFKDGVTYPAASPLATMPASGENLSARMIRTVVNDDASKTYEKYFISPEDFTTTSQESANIRSLLTKGYKDFIGEELLRAGRTQISGAYTNYAPFGSLFKPSVKLRYENNENTETLNIVKYDNFGNPLYITEIGQPDKCYIWSYKNQYPVAEIVNATYAQVEAALGVINIASIGNATTLSDQHFTLINSTLRSALPSARITVYTYVPLVGMTSATDPSGRTTKYYYDAAGRLSAAKDDKQNLVESYEYKF